ncbi:MAG: tRNA (adenosine(37)-N6)-dimethylallyltransferase MiaA [Brevundimonas sp.]|uniref:tRNA (adenosine(37)-N6)-dimethylallyltransferase MiaA n=1 Tax=Brevundimonas sp. TaxID=1871086 RepID=UPI00391ABC81
MARNQAPISPVTLIGGATASGKSRLALDLARETGAVIINADSQQLYADLRVLTARPGPDEEAQAEHRLYGVADAAEAWSVGKWLRAAEALLNDDGAGGRPVIVVGGTGLYFNALTRGLADVPPVPPEVRAALDARFAAEGEAAFRRALAEVDAPSEAAIEAGDRQRLVRALAVAQVAGRPLSALRAETRPVLAPGAYEALVVEPDRKTLYAACDTRVSVMMANGALEEVRALMARDLPHGLPIMKAVGVRELGAHLRGELSMDDALDIMRQATRNYAKRQLTWFRNQTPDWRRVLPPA